MRTLVNKIANYFVNEDIICTDDIPWFVYCIERRISTIAVGIPFLILAFAISTPAIATSFFASYFFVRKYIGGYHAKTMWGCITFSLFVEVAFLIGLPHLLNIQIILLILCVSIVVVLKLAPYNHPNMHFSSEEVASCRKKGLNHIYIASLVTLIAHFTESNEITNGCTIGIAMATTLLCLGYLHDWRNIHREQQNQKGSKTDCHKDDIEWSL